MGGIFGLDFLLAQKSRDQSTWKLQKLKLTFEDFFQLQPTQPTEQLQRGVSYWPFWRVEIVEAEVKKISKERRDVLCKAWVVCKTAKDVERVGLQVIFKVGSRMVGMGILGEG